jgi:hypothetical protein
MQLIEHPWQLTPAEGAELQNELRQRVERNDRLPAIRHVAGVDVGYEAAGRVTRAAVAVLAYPGLQMVKPLSHRRRGTRVSARGGGIHVMSIIASCATSTGQAK